jgi:hypothetical protein
VALRDGAQLSWRAIGKQLRAGATGLTGILSQSDREYNSVRNERWDRASELPFAWI